MLITILFIIIFIVQLSKTTSTNRKVLSFIALGIYTIISMLDLFWLENIEHISFHLSDPTVYHTKIQGLTFREVLNIESSNTFYYIINWFYDLIWGNETIISFWVKINNILVTVCTYLLFSKKLSKVTYIDYLLLFNPYTLMTLIRNVRDMYIILFVLMIILGMGVIKDNKLNKFWTLLAVGLLSITRSVLLVPMLIIYWMKHKHLFSRQTQYVFYIVALAVIFTFRFQIIAILSNQMLSSMAYIGEDTQELIPLLSGNITFPILKFVFIRIFIGTISFMFTPHPVNYISKWLENMSDMGGDGIYTGFDNFLISLGSIFNYLFVIPVVIAFWINWKKINKYILVFVICYIALYVISYLGVTDIRNRNTAIFFILIGVLFSNEPIRIKPLYYILSGCIFLGLLILSA